LLRDLELVDLANLLAELIPRVRSQQDYNALLDFINLSLHDREATDTRLQELLIPLLRMRSRFPAVGNQTWAWDRLGVRAAQIQPTELAHLAVDLIDQDALRIYGPDEGAVLRSAIQEGGRETWEVVMNAVQAGNWKLTMSVDGWLGGLLDLDTVSDWIGVDRERARAVASVSTVGEDAEMHELARYLLSAFPKDRRIESSLYGDFVSGSWMGNESSRIMEQIALIEGWERAHSELAGVRHWCAGVLDSLRSRLSAALREEAEEDGL
jgi:hypothetical protein